MIGNRVRVLLTQESNISGEVSGTLHKLDAAGAMVWRESTLPEGRGGVFIPMHRIREIVDLGRAP